MLAGTSPFKDSSEWLIFQRIVARDLRFPDYFSNEARDLVDRLLVNDQLLALYYDSTISVFSCLVFPHV